MFDHEDRLFLARMGVRVVAAVTGVILAAGTLGMAWRVFWLAAG